MAAARDGGSLCRIGADPVAWIAAHRPGIKVRLRLIKVPRIEAGTVGRSDIPVVNVGYTKATAWPARWSDMLMANADSCRRQQLGGKGRRRHRNRAGDIKSPI